MNKINGADVIKAVVISVATLISSWLGTLAMPMYFLVFLNISDFITGLIAAPYRNEKRDADKGFRGIAKKICMWLLVAIGAVTDWIIEFATFHVGIVFPFTFFIAILVAIWLICNEIISILENMIDIGIDLPPFLRNFVSKIKDTIEQKGDTE